MPQGDDIRAMFAGIARRYDLLNRLLSLRVDRRWRRRTVQAVAPPRPGRILDLCCGTADLALDLAHAGQAVTGVDFCREMLVIGRRKALRLGRAAPRLVEADALSLPFATSSYDGATVAFGVRNLQDLDRGLAEAARVLKPGAVLAVLEFGRPRGRLLSPLYAFYLNVLVPLVGRLVSRDHGAYGYLATSIQAFEDQETFPRRLARAGFVEIHCENLSGGIAALYTARKPR